MHEQIFFTIMCIQPPSESLEMGRILANSYNKGAEFNLEP